MYEINHERRGTGSPLVLLHGIGHRWQAWNPVLDLLAEQHEVIAIDLPGFGRSAPMPPDKEHDLPTMITVLAEIFDQLGVKSPHVAGNSLGGLIAIEAAAQGLVSSATALSPGGFWARRDRFRAISTLALLRAGALAPGPLRLALSGPKPLRSLSLGVLYAHPERIDAHSARADMAALRNAAAFRPTLRTARRFAWSGTEPTVPLTVAWAERDRILPARQAELAAALLPSANHVLLPGCGHVPMIDDPPLVARTILQTCARADAADSAA